MSALAKMWWLGHDGLWRSRGEELPPPPPTSTPKAAFTTSLSGVTASFDASSSTDVGSTLVTYAWTFGDGSAGTGKTVSHTYPGNGTFTVELTVTDVLNASATATSTVAVAIPVGRPSAAFNLSTTYLAASFDASGSTDIGSTITTYAWTLGDGSTGTGKTINHTYTAAGTYTATLTVTDASGQTSSVSKPVAVSVRPVNQAPTAAIAATVSGASVTANGSGSSDPDGSIASYAWNWGDGSTNGSGVSATHTYATNGSKTITLTVTDNSGATATATKAVTVSGANTPPTASFTTSMSGAVLSVDASASTDPDGPVIYDLTNIAPSHALTFTVAQPSAMQCAVPSPDTGFWYVSQRTNGSNGTTTPYENLTINKCNATTGALVDSMTITDGGHGTGFALEYAAGVLYVWIAIQVPATAGGTTWDICRFPYKAGTFTRAAVPGLTVMYKNSQIGSGGKAHVSFDVANGYCVTYDEISQTQNVYKRWLLSDFLAKKLTQVGPTVTDTRPAILQGWAGCKDSLFIYTGSQDGMNGTVADPIHLREFSWLNGAVLSDKDLTGMGATNGVYPTGHWEPESSIIYQPTAATAPVIYLGLTLGAPSTPHTYPIYNATLPLKSTITSYGWNWGDGTTGTGKTATHTYAASGTYTVTLTVADNGGATGTATKSVTAAVASPPTPAPSGGNGDSGINQTGAAGKQQAGGTQYQSLSGSTLQAKVTAAGTAGVSFPSGTFNMNVFSGSGTSGVSVNYPTGIKALLGAGSASTVLQMPANTDTGHSNLSSGTTAIFEHQLSSPADGFVMDGIRFEGTPQGGSGSLLYHLMQIGSIGNATISNCTFTGGKGTGGSPPLETFQLSIWHQAAGKTLLVKNCTFDGKDQTTGALTSAANAATNGAMYGTVTFQDCLFTNAGASAGLALWLQMTGSVVNLIRPVFKNNHRNLGNEAQGGDINIYDPMFYLPTTAGEDDIRITWTADANSGHINLYFTAQSNLDAMMAARGGKLLTSQVAAKNATMYGSSHPPYSGPNDPPNFCHIFVAGKEVNRATYWSVPAGK